MGRITPHKKVSFKVAVLIIGSVSLVIGALELQALKAKEYWRNPPGKISAGRCLQCHTDPKSIKGLRDKEDGQQLLFNADGTFKEEKYKDFKGDYQHGNFHHADKNKSAK